MAFSLVGVATDLVSSLGYAGLSAGLILDSFGLPIPSEVLIPLAVVAARHGRFQLWVVVVLAVAAQLVGGSVSYALARRFGTAAVTRFGRYVFVTSRDVERAERAFARHGSWMVGVGRCVPFVRGFIGYPAGAARMGVARFVAWTVAGAAIWTVVLAGLGELWRTHLGTISQVVDDVSYVVVALCVLALGRHLVRARRRAGAGRLGGPGAGPDGEVDA